MNRIMIMQLWTVHGCMQVYVCHTRMTTCQPTSGVPIGSLRVFDSTSKVLPNQITQSLSNPGYGTGSSRKFDSTSKVLPNHTRYNKSVIFIA